VPTLSLFKGSKIEPPWQIFPSRYWAACRASWNISKGQKIGTLHIKAQPAPLGTRIHSDKLLSQNVELFHDFAPLNAQIGSILAPISTLLHRENRPFAPNQAISSGEYALRACPDIHTDRFGLERGSDPQNNAKKGRRKWLNFDQF
jgi:hypothetical protein